MQLIQWFVNIRIMWVKQCHKPFFCYIQNGFDKPMGYPIVISTIVNIISMDWFKGTFTGTPNYLMVKTTVSCKFSLKPIH